MRTVGNACRRIVLASLMVGAGCGSEPAGPTERTGSDIPYLIKDIVPGPGWSNPDQFTLSGRFTYFVAQDPAHGREIWRTDGTETRTILLKDIVPGPSDIGDVHQFTDVNGTLFFRASDLEHGNELWKSDGTPAGTRLVKDINTGPQVSGPYPEPFRGSSFPSLLTNVNGTLFFVACDEEHGHELWMSDGTETGTRLVKDILPGTGITSPRFQPSVCLDGPSGPELLTAMNGILYFLDDVPEFGRELWRSDGTAEGTFMVKDTVLGPNPPTAPTMGTGPVPPRTAVVKGVLFFPNYGDLWRTDGTAEGTVLVTERFPWLLTGSRDFVFFASGDGLWRTDGTQAGTLFLKPMSLALTLRFDNRWSDMRGTDQGVYLDAAVPGRGYEPWFSDGTPDGTHLIDDINPGSPDSYPQSAVWSRGRVYFFANDAQNGWQLWRANDAGEDARRLTDLKDPLSLPDRPTEAPFSVGSGPNGIVFSEGDLEHGVELWGLNPR